MKVSVILLALSLCALNAADPFAENVRTTEPLPATEQQKRFHLPPGFEIQLVAAEPDLRKPMNMAFDTAGRLWLTESREYPWPTNTAAPRDTIRILSEFDENGRARKMTIFATNLNIPIGLYPFLSPASEPLNAPRKDLTWKCIAWSIPNIWLLEDLDGDGKADKQTPLYGPFGWERDTHGNQASFRRGFDGWIYATHGYNNNSTVHGRDGHEISMNSGNTYRFRIDGSRIEQHTWGQVNPFGLAWDAFGNLYSSDCHSAPAYQLLAGGYYPSFGKPHDGLGFAPVLMEHSHGSTAIDGIVCYTDDLWPAGFRDNIFIGNVMTSRVNRDRLTFRGSSPRAHELDDFVKCADPWFRPVDNQLGPDGAFYIADFYNRIIGHYEVPLTHPGRDRERGRIWRVFYRSEDGKARLRPLALPNELDGLVKELASPSLARRMLAMNAIEDQFGKSAAAALQPAVTDPLNSFQRVHALWLLHRLKVSDWRDLSEAGRSNDPLMRVHAERIAGDIYAQDNVGHLASDNETDVLHMSAAGSVTTAGLKDHDPLVQRSAAEAISKFNLASTRILRLLLELLPRVPEEDTHLAYVVRKSIRDELRRHSVFEKVLAENWSEADERTLASVCLAVTNSGAAAFLLTHLQKRSEPRDVMTNYLKHAARYLPAERMDELATFARDKLGKDIEFHLALFKSVQQGLEQRGEPLSGRLKSWGAELAEELLALGEESTLAWSTMPLEDAANTTNPWFVQKRVSADGDNASLFLCSLPPGGESLTGVLRSQPFTIPAKLTFWCAGHDGQPGKPGQKKNVVRLRLAGSNEVAAENFAPRNDTAQQISWDLSRHAGQRGFLEVRDADDGESYAWLAVGRFDPPVAPIPASDPGSLSKRYQAGADIAARLQLVSLQPRLKELLAQKSADAESRVSAARALMLMDEKNQFASLAAVLADSTVPVHVREFLGVGVVNADSAARSPQSVILESLRGAPHRVQAKVAQALAGTAAGAELLLQSVDEGKLPAMLLQDRAVKDKLLAAKIPNAAARIDALTKSLSPPNAELQKLLDKRREGYKPARAKANEGMKVFTKTCAICHSIDGQGANIGPQLDGIGNRGLERLCEDILDPNRNVDRAFRTTIISLKEGDVVSGLFRREEGEVVVLADSTGKEISISKKQIGERRETESSPMPENFGELLTAEEFNHLMAFLLSKR